MSQFTQSPIWPQILKHAETLKGLHLRELFKNNPERFKQLSLKAGDILLDYSKQRLTQDTFMLLEKLLLGQGFVKEREALFKGEKVNRSEGRAAHHTVLRSKKNTEVCKELSRALEFAEQLRAGQIKGASGKAIKNIIHIGIGGSDLGPQLLVKALANENAPNIVFIRNVDAAPIADVIRHLNPEETILLIASKTFTTVETLLNAKTLLAWIAGAVGSDKALQHVVALTAAPEKALAFGVLEKQIFRFWDWVGGRFSIWSVIGLPAMIAMGRPAFEAFIAGGAEMDAHFLNAPLLQNMPAQLALISFWNINVQGFKARAVLPYCEALSEWPAYLQQLEMESLGKSVDKDGESVSYATAPVVFGMTGTPAQHAFMQALHQGTEIIPSEIILVKNGLVEHQSHHPMLLANGLAQAEALAIGKATDSSDVLAAQKSFSGNRPSSVLVLDELSPHVLGQLVALYEHKVFTESVLWNTNAFDQWGVELGKTLASPIQQALENGRVLDAVTSSTAALANYLRKS